MLNFNCRTSSHIRFVSNYILDTLTKSYFPCMRDDSSLESNLIIQLLLNSIYDFICRVIWKAIKESKHTRI